MPSVYAVCLDPDHYNIYFEMVVPDRTIDIVARTELKAELKAFIDQVDPQPNPKLKGWLDQPNPTEDPVEMMRCINILLATLPNHSSDPLFAVAPSEDASDVYCIADTLRICYHPFALARVQTDPTPSDYVHIETIVNKIQHTAPLLMAYAYSTKIWP